MNPFYLCTFIAAIILSVIYIFRWQRRFDINITLCFFLVPFVNLAYLLMYTVNKADTVIFALKITYLGGVFLTLFIMLCVLNLCKIQVSRMFRLIAFLINVLLYLSVLTIGIYPIFYKSLTITAADDGKWQIVKEYSFLHPVFYAVIIIESLISLTALIYSRVRKKDVSKTILNLLFIPLLASVAGYLLNHIIFREIDVMPLMYVVAECVYIIIVRRMILYEMSDMVIETMVQSGETGFINVDFDHRYLGSNETAKDILPELKDLAVDDHFADNGAFNESILKWIGHFENNEQSGRILYEKAAPEDAGKKYYNVVVNYLYDGTKKRGYQIFLADDTQNQKYIKLIDHYNSELEKEVTAKTESVINMQNKMVLGMATMVESRDNSTGGHIKRTSDVVRLLVEQIKRDDSVVIPHKFCDDLIKAAPMHDLGKIAVDDDILRKPGRFSPEEYEIMKTHAEKGAVIIHAILEDINDKEFSRLAENVAHYHHERWDGKGYPKGLAGSRIPYEARVMAIADVYDALVSKRVYKEKMSFDEADRIIRENMGSQFDPGLYKYYEAARPQLEEYYGKIG